jgi:glutamate--cysteine ligase catalytic subunit
MRKFVQEHPSYRQDSVIPPDLAYDLMMECNEIGLGARPCPDVLGNFSVERYTNNQLCEGFKRM